MGEWGGVHKLFSRKLPKLLFNTSEMKYLEIDESVTKSVHEDMVAALVKGPAKTRTGS